MLLVADEKVFDDDVCDGVNRVLRSSKVECESGGGVLHSFLGDDVRLSLATPKAD
jgi:hypothetical protein